MNSFVLNFRRAFARVRTTLFAVTTSVANWRAQRKASNSDSDVNTVRRKWDHAVPSLNGTHRSGQVLLALLAMTIGETAVAGTYPASYIFRNSVYGL